MDKIKISDLEVFAYHGVFPEENKLGQKFFVSLTLFTDTRAAGLADDLNESIDYGKISHCVNDFLRANTYKLIETAAENLASHLLKNTARLEKVKIEIKKPYAPIGLPLGYVSVEIERGWHTAYIALGSNIGDRRKYIEKAVNSISSLDGCQLIKISELIETKPYSVENQADFLNGCAEIKTLCTPKELLNKLNTIEAGAGRERKERHGPRTLDLDILLYDNIILNDERLTIPHIDMVSRDFVLTPLAEIAPYAIHPVSGKTIRQLLDELKLRQKPF